MNNFQKILAAGLFAFTTLTVSAQEAQNPQEQVSKLREYVIENGTFMNVTYNGVEFPTYRLESGDYRIDVNRGSTQIVRSLDNRADFFVDYQNDGDADRYFGSTGPFNQIDLGFLTINAYAVSTKHEVDDLEYLSDSITGSISGLMDPALNVARHSDAFKNRYEFYLDAVTAPELALDDKIRLYDYANKVSEVRDASSERSGQINTHAQNAYKAILTYIMNQIVK